MSAPLPGGAQGVTNDPLPLLARLGSVRPGMPICLITGFLGAGKTTLVNHILANSQGLRAAVFINEYGSIDVDGALVRSRVDEDRVITLTNGCVCCEINEDLAVQLSRLLGARRESIDVVIIETSGVCDPEPVLTTLQQVEDIDQVHLDAVICVVDAMTLGDTELGGSADAKRQLAHADVVLLNKVDLLADAASADRTERKLRSLCEEQGLRPPPAILPTVRAGADLTALCGVHCREAPPRKSRRLEPAGMSKVPAPAQPHDHNGHHSRFSTFAYRAAKPFDMMRFERWAEDPPAGVLRAKGLIWVRGVPKYISFHLAGRRTNPFETLPTKETPVGSEIVFVGREGTMDFESVREALNDCLC